MTAMISLTVSINCRLALEVHAWTRFEIGAFFLTAFFLAMTCLMFNDVYPSPIEYVVPLPSLDWSEFYGSIPILYPQIAFWCCIFLITVLSLIPRMVVKGWCAPPSAPQSTSQTLGQTCAPLRAAAWNTLPPSFPPGTRATSRRPSRPR